MKNFTHFLSLTILWLLLITACGESEPESNYTVSHDVNGIFVSANPANLTATIIHEEIPEVMNAMRMSLRLDTFSSVADFEQGDKINFKLERVGVQWYARHFEKLPDDTELDIPEELTKTIQ